MIAFILNTGDMKGGGGGPRGGKSKAAIEKAQTKAKQKKSGKADDGDGAYGVSKTKRMTGLWRHKDYLRCGSGMVAMSLLSSMYHKTKVNFYEELYFC